MGQAMRILLVLLALSGLALAAVVTDPADPTHGCLPDKPEWLTPPEDAAVQGPPAPGYYWVNGDHSIWASAGWAEAGQSSFEALQDGVKIGWFRPAGEQLVVLGKRLDAPAPPLETHLPCCYPTRFQASGLYFPTGGCWLVMAVSKHRDMAFVVWIKPAGWAGK